MVQISAIFILSAFATLASAAPIEKRIAQTISESTKAWEAACIKAGGAQQCNPISQIAFTSLLAAGKNCDQQDAADKMIDLAKTLNNDAEMIRLAQLFVQQPRNAPDSLQVPYCQVAPKNAELNGLFHCQFAGSNFAKFSGDQTGNLPLGVAAVNPPGSCPAKTDGPVPDGVQLNTLVQDPGVGGTAPAPAPAPSPSTGPAPPSAPSPSSGPAPPTAPSSSTGPALPQATAPSTISAPAKPAANPTKGFVLQNGKDAKALNAKFASLTPASPCNDGDQACVAGGFAQCIGGKFVITQCAGGTICAALPLVNKPGTSITCTSQAEADARIAATGA